MPQGLQDDHESLPRHSVEIQPGATPTAPGGERQACEAFLGQHGSSLVQRRATKLIASPDATAPQAAQAGCRAWCAALR